jgi:hypothetical protein
MQRIEDIESAIRGLSPVELRQFREWYLAFDTSCWDREIERHAAEGKLDALADQALADLARGHCTEL